MKIRQSLTSSKHDSYGLDEPYESFYGIDAEGEDRSSLPLYEASEEDSVGTESRQQRRQLQGHQQQPQTAPVSSHCEQALSQEGSRAATLEKLLASESRCKESRRPRYTRGAPNRNSQRIKGVRRHTQCKTGDALHVKVGDDAAYDDLSCIKLPEYHPMHVALGSDVSNNKKGKHVKHAKRMMRSTSEGGPSETCLQKSPSLRKFPNVATLRRQGRPNNSHSGAPQGHFNHFTGGTNQPNELNEAAGCGSDGAVSDNSDEECGTQSLPPTPSGYSASHALQGRGSQQCAFDNDQLQQCRDLQGYVQDAKLPGQYTCMGQETAWDLAVSPRCDEGSFIAHQAPTLDDPHQEALGSVFDLSKLELPGELTSFPGMGEDCEVNMSFSIQRLNERPRVEFIAAQLDDHTGRDDLRRFAISNHWLLRAP